MGRKVGRPSSQLLRELERVLTIELREDLGVALRVGVFTALGNFTEAQMKAKLGIDQHELREAKALLKRATARLRDERKGYSEVLQEAFREPS